MLANKEDRLRWAKEHRHWTEKLCLEGQHPGVASSLLTLCNAVRAGGREVRRRRMNLVKTELFIKHLKKTQRTKVYKNNIIGCKTECTPAKNTHLHTTNNLWQGHEGKQRVKYTACNEWDWNQVCRKTRQNQWKMKNGSMMAKGRWLDRRTPPEQGEGPTSAEVVTVQLYSKQIFPSWKVK